MSYTDFQNSPDSEKIGLVTVNCGQLLKGWTLYSGSIYFIPFSRVLVSVEDTGVTLNGVSSLGAVVANSYYWDRQASLLYVRTSDSVNPNSKFIVAESKFFFSNVAIHKPYDLASGFEVNWLPLLKGTSDFGVELDNQNQFGLALEGSGSVDLINDHEFWDPIFDKVTFENKECLIYSYSRDLPVSEAKLVYRGLIERKSWSSSSVGFKLKDTLNELRSPVGVDNLEDFPSAKVSSKDLLTKQRLVYGYVYGHRPSNIDQLEGGKYQLTGSVAVTTESATVTGTGTSFFAQLSPDDQIIIATDEEEYSVASITSDTVITLSEVYAGETGSGLSIYIKPSLPKRYINREFLIAGHALREPTTTVTSSPSLAYVKVADTSELDAGSVITVGSERTGVLRVSDDKVFFTTQLINLASIGATVTRLSVSDAWIGDRELVYSRDYTFDASDGTFTLGALAEFNVAPVKKLLGTSITITNASRAVTGVATFFLNDLKPGDWIRAFGEADYFEISSIETDTALTLRTLATYTATAAGRFKSPEYYDEGKYFLSIDCIGKTEDGTTGGDLIKTGPQIVKDLLINVGVSLSDIDNASFTLAQDLATARLGVVIPSKVGDKTSPKVRDVINKINQTIFGSLIQTNEFKLKYNVLSPKRTLTASTFTEKDVLSFSINSDSSRLVKTSRINYLNKEYDHMAGQVSFQQYVVTSNEGTYLIKTSKEFTQDSLLVEESEARMLASRYSFLFQVASSVVKIGTKLKAARLEVNDKVTFEHEKLYERLASNTKRKIAAIQSVKKTVFDSNIEIEDLSNAFTRCGVITENSHPDYVDSNDLQRAMAGYVTDPFGMQENDPETFGISLIW